MIPEITLGAASIMGSLVAATAAVRWAVRPAPVRGMHRREYGAVVPQRLVHCPACETATTVTVHGSLLLCAENHQIGGCW